MKHTVSARSAASLILTMGMALAATAQVSVPNSFSPGGAISASLMNANFAALVAAANDITTNRIGPTSNGLTYAGGVVRLGSSPGYGNDDGKSGALYVSSNWATPTPAIQINQPFNSWSGGTVFANYRYFRTLWQGTGNPAGSEPINREYFKTVQVGPGGVAIGYDTTPGYGANTSTSDYPAMRTSDALYVNGNVGIGTNTPSAPLHLVSALAYPFKITGSNTGQTTMQIGNASNTWSFDVAGSTNSNLSPGGIGLYSGATGYAFSILPNKNVGIGNSTPSYPLDVSGNIRTTGTLTQTSDRRLKKDIAAVPAALEALGKLRGVSYKWSDPKADQSTQLGVIAQELEPVYPELVSTDTKGMKSVNYNGFVAPFIEAIKELKAASDQKGAAIASLQAENAELKKRLAAIEKKLGM